VFLESLQGADFDGHDRDNHAVMACMVGCHYDKDMGVLAMLRGHKTDSAFYTRRAMEYAAFGAHILKAILQAKDDSMPKKVTESYLNGIRSNTAFDKYRSEFPIMELLGDSNDVFGQWFRKQYEELCKEAHASFESISLKLQFKKEGGYHFTYYEIDAEKGIGKGLDRLFQLAEIHIGIMKGFVNLLESAARYDSSPVNGKLNELESLLDLEKRCWASSTKSAREKSKKWGN
jgi:hypothetical protein